MQPTSAPKSNQTPAKTPASGAKQEAREKAILDVRKKLAEASNEKNTEEAKNAIYIEMLLKKPPSELPVPASDDSVSAENVFFRALRKRWQKWRQFEAIVRIKRAELSAEQMKELPELMTLPLQIDAFTKMIPILEKYRLKDFSRVSISEKEPDVYVRLSKDVPDAFKGVHGRWTKPNPGTRKSGYDTIIGTFGNIIMSGKKLTVSQQKGLDTACEEFLFFHKHIEQHLEIKNGEFVPKDADGYFKFEEKTRAQVQKAIGFAGIVKPEEFQTLMTELFTELPDPTKSATITPALQSVLIKEYPNLTADIQSFENIYNEVVFQLMVSETDVDAPESYALTTEISQKFLDSFLRLHMRRKAFGDLANENPGENKGPGLLQTMGIMAVTEGMEEFAEEFGENSPLKITAANLRTQFYNLPANVRQSTMRILAQEMAKEGYIFMEGLENMGQRARIKFLNQFSTELKTQKFAIPNTRKLAIPEATKTQINDAFKELAKDGRVVAELEGLQELSPKVRARVIKSLQQIEATLLRQGVGRKEVDSIMRKLRKLNAKRPGFLKSMLEMARNPVTVMIFAMYIAQHPDNIQAALNWVAFIGISRGVGIGTRVVGSIPWTKALLKKYPRLRGGKYGGPAMQFTVVMALLFSQNERLNEWTSAITEYMPDNDIKEFLDATIGLMELPFQGAEIGINSLLGYNMYTEFGDWSSYIAGGETTIDLRKLEHFKLNDFFNSKFTLTAEDWNKNVTWQQENVFKGNKQMHTELESTKMNYDWACRKALDLQSKVTELEIRRSKFLQAYVGEFGEDGTNDMSAVALEKSLKYAEEMAVTDEKIVEETIGFGHNRNDRFIKRLFDNSGLSPRDDTETENQKNFYAATRLMEGGDYPAPSREKLENPKEKEKLTSKESFRLQWDLYKSHLESVSLLVSMYKHLKVKNPNTNEMERVYHRRTWLGKGPGQKDLSEKEQKLFTSRVQRGLMSHLRLQVLIGMRHAPPKLPIATNDSLFQGDSDLPTPPRRIVRPRRRP